MNIKTLIGAAAFAVAAGAANAGTVNIQITEFSAGDVTGANTALDAFMAGSVILATEGFGGHVGEADPSTTVGDFAGIPPADPGSSAVDCGGGLGLTSCVKTGAPVFGRYDTSGDGSWLDTNDMAGLLWTIPGTMGVSNFSKIAFLLTDIDDVRKVLFSITAAGSSIASKTEFNDANGEDDGTLHLVTMDFDVFVSDLVITMMVGKGDGAGIDSISIGVVPLPAAGWLLLGGIGGLAALKRRKKA